MSTNNTPDGIGFRLAFAGLCADWADPTLMRFGERMWQRAREKLSKDDREDRLLLQDGVAMYLEKLYEPAPLAKRLTAMRFGVFALTWAVHAFQTIMTSHTYAAALMCSDPSPEILASLEVPYLAFMVHVPAGLLVWTEDGVTVDYTRILVTCHSGYDGEAHMTFYDPLAPQGVDRRSFAHTGPTLSDLLFDDTGTVLDKGGNVASMGGTEIRITRLAKRLVAGLLLAMQHQDNFKSRTVHARSHRTRGLREPEHRITIVGKPLSIDCRGQIREYLTRKGSAVPPSVQSLVRGHYKRQVIGVGRHGRKVVWVEPYWRGPEDAPILTRPKMLGKSMASP